MMPAFVYLSQNQLTIARKAHSLHFTSKEGAKAMSNIRVRSVTHYSSAVTSLRRVSSFHEKLDLD